ncbi:MAG: hypothetical protein J3T61_00780 [Candidatus Brocadiales bacterium]|nr:hypothetical protein [Candidatus Bathyanammoxibius sp.]
MTYRFTIDRLPSRELSPNWKGHWSKFHKAMQMDKSDAYAYFLHQCTRPEKPLEAVQVTVRVYRKGKQRMDPDNFSARMKGYWDGLVDVGLLKDDSTDVIKTVEYIFEVDPEKAGREGLVEFQITEA